MGVKKSSRDCPDKVECFELSGKIYHENVAALEKSLDKSIRKGIEQIVLDCSELKIIDSSGLSVLVDTIKKLSGRDGSLHLCDMSESVSKIFELTSLEKFIEAQPDVETALEEIDSGAD